MLHLHCKRLSATSSYRGVTRTCVRAPAQHPLHYVSAQQRKPLGSRSSRFEKSKGSVPAQGSKHRLLINRALAEDNRPTALVSIQREATIGDLVKYFGITVGASVAIAAACIYINQFSTTPCTVAHTCEEIGAGIKVALVATHLYTFLLIPATMYVFYDKIDEMKQEGARSPFTALVGLGYVMTAIASEIGWHVTQAWYYKEEYAVLNLGFYLFLVTGLCMWAYGIRIGPELAKPKEPKGFAIPSIFSSTTSGAQTSSFEDLTDKFLIAAPFLTGAFYLLGASITHTKVPIYILMLLVFVVLTNRFHKMLRTPWVYLFPVLSVGVNLGFIALLSMHQEDPFLNPLFHIMHDALGTEAGIAVIAVLMYLGPPVQPSISDKSQQ